MANLRSGTTKPDTHCVVCAEQINELMHRMHPGVPLATTPYVPEDRTLEAGQDIFRAGEPCEAIYSLVDGWACLYNLLVDGRRQILQFALPGDVLAYQTNPEAIATYSAGALTRAVVCVVPHKSIPGLTREVPELGMRLSQIISRDRALAYDHMLAIGRRTARERVAFLLLELFVRYRAQWPGRRIDEMHLPLTQEHIGDAAGLTGVHVNRVLHDLRKRGIVEFRYHRLRVLNPDKLMDEAGVPPDHVTSWSQPDRGMS